MAQDTVTNLAEVIAEVNALDVKFDGEVERIDGEIEEVSNNLANVSTTLTDKVFYADEQDGKLGINTDPNRGADTFTPFSHIKPVVNKFNFAYADSVSDTTNIIAENSSVFIITVFTTSWETAKSCTVTLNGVNIPYDEVLTTLNAYGGNWVYILNARKNDEIIINAYGSSVGGNTKCYVITNVIAG